MMQTLVKIFGKPIRKTVQWYLSKPREYRYENISITIDEGVFHPGLFFSTRLILKFLETQNLQGKKFLELGSGSGLIAVYAAKKGAHVTAVDINRKAVRNTLENSNRNHTDVVVLESDLLDNVPPTLFDWVVLNPPYYPVDPANEEEYAWNCGVNHQYFVKLFSTLPTFISPQSHILMILSDVCDLQTIFALASANGFVFKKILERRVWADGRNYLYWIKQA